LPYGTQPKCSTWASNNRTPRASYVLYTQVYHRWRKLLTNDFYPKSNRIYPPPSPSSSSSSTSVEGRVYFRREFPKKRDALKIYIYIYGRIYVRVENRSVPFRDTNEPAFFYRCFRTPRRVRFGRSARFLITRTRSRPRYLITYSGTLFEMYFLRDRGEPSAVVNAACTVTGAKPLRHGHSRVLRG